MTKYVINGGKTLNGEVTISGAKTRRSRSCRRRCWRMGRCGLKMPKIIDVTLQLEIMRSLARRSAFVNATTVEIRNSQHPSLKPHELERKLRASYYLLGVLLGKYGFAEVAMPGGCNFGGARPIDQHIKGLRGARRQGYAAQGRLYPARRLPEEGLHGAHIYFDVGFGGRDHEYHARRGSRQRPDHYGELRQGAAYRRSCKLPERHGGRRQGGRGYGRD